MKMITEISKNPDIPDIQRERSDRPKLPEGVMLAAGDIVITDKNIALEMFDKDYSIFIVDGSGDSIYVDSRSQIEEHGGDFTSTDEDLTLFLKDRENSLTAGKNPEQEQIGKTVAEISALTGLSAERINALPSDVRENVISMYLRNAGNISGTGLAEKLDKAVKEAEQTENPLKAVEEQAEENYNSIDGVINNLPQDKEQKTSIRAFISERKAKSAQNQENRTR